MALDNIEKTLRKNFSESDEHIKRLIEDLIE